MEKTMETESDSARDSARDSKIPVGDVQSTPDVEYVTGIKQVLVLATLTLVFFLVMLDNTILATAIPYITDQFHSLLDVGWYGSVYSLTSAALMPLVGKAYARMSTKWTYMVCIILFEVGSAICGAATSSKMLIVGRAVAGMGGSGLLSGCVIILNATIPPERQPALMGVLMAIGQIGIAAGPLIGGAFTQYATWRWCFYLNLPLGGAILAGMLFINIPDHLHKPSLREALRNPVVDFDLIGFALFAPATIMFFLALQYGGNTFAWGSRQVIGLFVGTGLTYIAWGVWNWRAGDNAMIPVSSLQKRVVWVSVMTSLFSTSTMFITAYYLPIYFQAVRNQTPFDSGVDILPNIIAQSLFAIIGGISMEKVGYYTPFLIVGNAINIVGMGLLSLIGVNTPTGQWIGYQIVFGAGRGLFISVPFIAVQNVVAKAEIPAVTSVLMFSQSFGAAVMLVLAQTIFTNGLTTLIPQHAPGADVAAIIKAGSTAFRAVVPDNLLPGVLIAYAQSISWLWYFALGLCAPAFVLSFFIGWQNIKVTKKEDVDEEGQQHPPVLPPSSNNTE